MNIYTTDKIRNVVLLGHGGCGKTSLAEAMAYLAGLTNRMGTVVDGNTISDYDKEENKRQFYVPEGFAHGFLVLSDEAEFAYKCTDFYHPGDEGGLLWSDETIGVQWPIEEGMELIISEKDKKWGGFNDTFKFER